MITWQQASGANLRAKKNAWRRACPRPPRRAADGRQQPAKFNGVGDDSIVSDHQLSTALLDIIWLMNGNCAYDNATPRLGDIYRRIIGVICNTF